MTAVVIALNKLLGVQFRCWFNISAIHRIKTDTFPAVAAAHAVDTTSGDSVNWCIPEISLNHISDNLKLGLQIDRS